MFTPNDDLIKEMQVLYEKKSGKKLDRDEAIEACNNLVGFFELLHKVDMREGITPFAKRQKAHLSK